MPDEPMNSSPVLLMVREDVDVDILRIEETAQPFRYSVNDFHLIWYW